MHSSASQNGSPPDSLSGDLPKEAGEGTATPSGQNTPTATAKPSTPRTSSQGFPQKHAQHTEAQSWDTELIVLVGDSREQLVARTRRMSAYLADHADVCLKDLAATCAAELDQQQHRLAIVAESCQTLRERLARAASRLEDPDCRHIADGIGIYYTSQPLHAEGKVAFLFPGEGAQYLGMLAGLGEHFPEVREILHWSDGLLQQNDLTDALSRFMRLPEELEPARRAEVQAALRELDNAMISVLVADWAIGTVMHKLGIEPDVIAGHSAGELAALWRAGCINPEAEPGLIPDMRRTLREQAISNTGEEAALLAVGASRETAAKVIEAASDNIPPGQKVFIAMDNCPHQTVLVGHAAAVTAVETELKNRNAMHERLPFSKPYHTYLFEPYLKDLSALFGGVSFKPAETPVYSCTTGRLFPSDPDAIRQLMLDHWASPVEFCQMVENMYADGARIFIEVGPRGNLTSFVSDILRGKTFLAISADVQRRSCTTQLNHFAGQLVAHHVPMRLSELFSLRGPRPVPWDTAPPPAEGAVSERASDPSAGPKGHTPNHGTSATSAARLTDRAAADSVTPASACQPVQPDRPVPEVRPSQPMQPSQQTHPSQPMQPSQAITGSDTATGSPESTDPISPREAIMQGHLRLMRQLLTDQHHVTEAFLKRRQNEPSTGMRAPRVRRRGRGRGRSTPPVSPGRPQPLPSQLHPRQTPQEALPQEALPQEASPLQPHAQQQRTPLQQQTAPQQQGEPQSWPLLGEFVHHEPGQKLVMRRRMDLAEDLYAAEHTVGGRDVSQVDPTQHGLPVVPMTFNLEMMAEAASRLIPSQVVLGLEDVQLQRWLAIEPVPSMIQVTAERQDTRPSDPADGVSHRVRVEVRDLGPAYQAQGQSGAVASSGTVLLGTHYPQPPAVDQTATPEVRKPRVTLEQMYRNLFHGPLYQGVLSLEEIGDNHIDSRLGVLPRKGLFRSTDRPSFLLDPVLLDVSMHPSAAWHLEQPDQSGRILLPYELKRIRFYGPCPAVGDEMTCRSFMRHTTQRQFVQEGQIIDRQGRLWCHLSGVRSWRFYLPFGDVNFHGPKDEYFLTKDWSQVLSGFQGQTMETDQSDEEPEASFGGLQAESGAESWCVRMEPSPDLMQVALQSAAVQVTMTPRERQTLRELPGDSTQRSHWLYERIAAKDAVRILWRLKSGERYFPADIEIQDDQYGRLVARRRGTSGKGPFPRVAAAACGQTMLAVATFKPRVGVAMVAVDDGPTLAETLNDAEQALIAAGLQQPSAAGSEADGGGSQAIGSDEAAARLVCAKRAVAAALGPELISSLNQLHVRGWDLHGGAIDVTLGTELGAMFAELQGCPIRVHTLRRAENVVGATFCETGG
jgi:acyl transferase domain-containing protein